MKIEEKYGLMNRQTDGEHRVNTDWAQGLWLIGGHINYGDKNCFWLPVVVASSTCVALSWQEIQMYTWKVEGKR